MIKILPDVEKLRKDFICYAVGVEYQEITDINTINEMTINSIADPRIRLLINDEERISLLPLPFRKPFKLVYPIHIRATDILVMKPEQSEDRYIAILAGNIYSFKIKPRLALYGFYSDDAIPDDRKKGYFITPKIEIPESIYNLVIDGEFSLNTTFITKYEMKYETNLRKMFFYPRVKQLTVRTVKEKLGNVNIYTILQYDVVRLDKLSPKKIEMLFINQMNYETSVNDYVYDAYVREFYPEIEMKAEDKLNIGVNIQTKYKRDNPFSAITIDSNYISIYKEFGLYYRNNYIFPFAMNYE